MSNWVKVSPEEMKIGMSIAGLKKGELQIKYAKEVCRLNNIINELEKDINNEIMMTRKFDEYNEGFFNATLHFYNKLKELKEGNNENNNKENN